MNLTKVISMIMRAAILLILASIGRLAAAASLPEVKQPDFAVSREVIASLDSMIEHLKAAEKDGAPSWQIGRALGNCTDIRSTIAQWPDVGAYETRGAERLWKECWNTYRAVR